MGVGGDQAGVDGEGLAADQALGHAARDDRLEQLAQQVALTEAPVPVLGEGRVVRNLAVQPQAAEPAVGEVEVDLLAEPALGADAEAIADQQHADQQLGIDRGTSDRAVEGSKMRPHALQIDEAVDRPKQMILGHVPLERELVEERPLIHPTITHHGVSPRFAMKIESAASHAASDFFNGMALFPAIHPCRSER